MIEGLEGVRLRRPNRVSGPVRVTQAGTSTTYPSANYAKAARQRSRWAGVGSASRAYRPARNLT
jgi:hypothetical protein